MKKQSEMDASCWRKGKTLDASNAEVSSVSEDGAGGGTRTHTMSPSADFETAMQKFLLVKESQHTGEETMKDYRNCLARFLADSHNSLDYPLLESDVLTFFAAIPDTFPARYNKPFQTINAFLNWALEQELIGKNPIKVHKLHKRRDDGNIKPLPADKLQAFLASLDKSTYTGLRDYVICMQFSSTKESRRRSVWQSLMPSLSA